MMTVVIYHLWIYIHKYLRLSASIDFSVFQSFVTDVIVDDYVISVLHIQERLTGAMATIYAMR